MTTLIIARHGNTFESGEAPRRVGARTDLPLTSKGLEQGRKLGVWLGDRAMPPDLVYTSRLRRTIQTAAAALGAMDLERATIPDAIFDEIDYGPDENLPEDAVTARIGAEALRDWDERGIMPPGWSPDAATIRQRWQDFAHRIRNEKTVLVVTSNGIARFALDLASNKNPPPAGLKLATGALGILDHDGIGWTIRDWNIKP